jgi:glucarate dehydratase
MCVVAFEDFAPAMRLGAVDVIHGDVYKWGGIKATKDLAAHCETFGLGMNLHSGGELGIATAAHLAVVASTPVLNRAIDSMYYLHDDDIIDPIPLHDGRLSVPDGPGLGVRVDEDKLAHYAALNAREGDLVK